MREKDEEDFRNNKLYRFCEKKLNLIKLEIMSGKYRGPAHSNCNFNVTQYQCTFIPFIFHNFSIYDCHLFFKNLVDKKNDDKLKYKIIPKINGECFSIRNGCIRFIDSYRFLSSSLDSLVKTLVDNSQKTLKNL